MKGFRFHQLGWVCGLSIFYLMVPGCMTLPRSPQPAWFQDEVALELDKAWSAARGTVLDVRGKITLLDEESRFLVFQRGHGPARRKVYAQVLCLKDDAFLTHVYCFVFQGGRRSTSVLDLDYFHSFRRRVQHEDPSKPPQMRWGRRTVLEPWMLDPQWVCQGRKKSFPGREFDEVWNALLLVSMQSGVLLHSDKSTGFLVMKGVSALSLYLENNSCPVLFLREHDQGYRGLRSHPGLGGKILLDRLERQIDSEDRWDHWLGG